VSGSKRGRAARRRIARQRQQQAKAAQPAGSDGHEKRGGWHGLRIPAGVRRLRSRTVVLGAVAALVAGGGIYAAVQPVHCVDGNDSVVADDNCDSGTGGGSGGFHWYYGGRMQSGRMTGGGVERGGFGRIFSGFHGG
jgi:hypothetical protein